MFIRPQALTTITLTVGLMFGFAGLAWSADDTIKIGVLTDLSGPTSDANGPGSVLAAKMAIADAGGKAGKFAVELVQADHQLKPDIASQIARRWYASEGVDIILDVPVSPIALAVQNIAKSENKIMITAGSGSSDFTGKFCSETTMQWVFDTYSLARGSARALVKSGNDTWFIIAQDNAFGAAMLRDIGAVVEENGGKIIGSVRHPPQTGSDLSSFLMQAQGSKAKVIALASGPPDNINSIKVSEEFKIAQGDKQKLVGLLFFLTDVHAIGLKAAQGLVVISGFYWDQSPEARAWAERFFKEHGRMPTEIQAGVYSSARHYLRAVAAAGSRDAKVVAAKMRELPVEDFFAKGGTLRKDGRLVYDLNLVQVKTPGESKGPWDIYKILDKIPGKDAFRPIEKSECPLFKN
jgi:branched-chain amino acid transport system substrate-binding protein